MAFIRRVRTRSGATAVQVAEYVAPGRQRIVQHLGSARTEAELGVLLARARALLADSDQGVLDLDVQPSAPVARLVTAPPEPVLLHETKTPNKLASSRDGPGRVTGTDSRLLYQVLAGVYDDLGFAAVGDQVFKQLVVSRIVEPTSLLDAARVLDDLGQAAASYSTMRRTLRRAAAGGYRDTVTELCFTHALTHGDVSLVLYDVTTLYFEAEKEDSLRKVGFSKERRVDPQVVVGLLVDRLGFPLEIGCFEGNKAEKLTVVPIVKQFQARHEVADMVVVADAGMLSMTNLKALDKAGFRFIVGSRTTKAPMDLESHFRWHGDAFTDGQVIDTITPRIATAAARKANDPKIKAEPVWDPDKHDKSWRAVWAYSHKRAVRDRRTLQLQEDKARAVIAGEKAAHATRFVKTSRDGQVLDEASLARAWRLVGLKGYVTNLPADKMPVEEVISSYHDLWHVEQSFRMSKTDLRARPMYHHVRDSIEAHLTIVFTALAVSREVQSRTGLAIRNVIRQLRPLRSATIAINGTSQTFPPVIPQDQQQILDDIQTQRDVTH